jgi:hypothetical protein
VTLLRTMTDLKAMTIMQRRDWLIGHQKEGWAGFAVGFAVLIALPLGLASRQNLAVICGATFSAGALVFVIGLKVFRRLLAQEEADDQ